MSTKRRVSGVTPLGGVRRDWSDILRGRMSKGNGGFLNPKIMHSQENSILIIRDFVLVRPLMAVSFAQEAATDAKAPAGRARTDEI